MTIKTNQILDRWTLFIRCIIVTLIFPLGICVECDYYSIYIYFVKCAFKAHRVKYLSQLSSSIYTYIMFRSFFAFNPIFEEMIQSDSLTQRIYTWPKLRPITCSRIDAFMYAHYCKNNANRSTSFWETFSTTKWAPLLLQSQPFYDAMKM